MLLAPRTGQLVADAVEGKETSSAALLDHFRWSRFLSGPASEAAASASLASALQGRAVTPASKPVQPTPTQPQFTAPSAAAAAVAPTPSAGVHNDDPHADYAQMRAQGGGGGSGGGLDPEAVLREARRVNREGLVGYGLGDDPVGREVAGKFNVPSSAAAGGGEWDAFEAAERAGVADLGMFDIKYLTDTSHFGESASDEQQHHAQQQHQAFEQSSALGVVTPGPGPEDETVGELMARLGYEYREPRAAKVEERELIRRGLAQPAGAPSATAAPGGKKAPKPMDVYDEIYSEEVRPKVGWQVLREREQREREQQQQRQQEQQEAAGGKGGGGGVHNDDPYADYHKMRTDAAAEARGAAELREARRKNREGVVGYGLGEDPVGREVASKFNVPSAAGMDPEWDQYEAAAMQGLQDMGRLGGGASSAAASAGLSGLGQTVVERGGDAGAGPTIDELMRELGYEYEDPRVAKAQAKAQQQHQQQQAPSRLAPAAAAAGAAPAPVAAAAPMPSPAPAPAPVPAAKQPFKPRPAPAVSTELPLPPRGNTGAPPPWAHRIEELYETIRANQAAAAKRVGVPAPDAVVVPFRNRPEDCPRDAQGRPRPLTAEEVLGKLEVMRVNPDGSFTRVEPGKGLPAPWQAGQAGQAGQAAGAAAAAQQEGVGR